MPRVPVRNDDLQIDDNKDFERWDWRAQRIGWALMALVLVGAFVGVFGRGPLAHSNVDLSNGATIRFERITRHQSPAELIVERAASAAETVIVDISRAFMDGVDLRYIEPEPDRIETIGDTIRLVIATAPRTNATVKIAYEPSRYWSRDGWVLVDGAGTRFTQFVLP